MKDKKKNILDILNKISDLNFQKKFGLKDCTGIVSSFDESVNTLADYRFFDDVTYGVIKLATEEEQIQLEKFISRYLHIQDFWKILHLCCTTKNGNVLQKMLSLFKIY